MLVDLTTLLLCLLTFSRHVEDFEIIHGELHGLSDTVAFLKSLSGLSDGIDSGKALGKRQMRERIAASGIFNWEVIILFPFSFWNLILISLIFRNTIPH